MSKRDVKHNQYIFCQMGKMQSPWKTASLSESWRLTQHNQQVTHGSGREHVDLGNQQPAEYIYFVGW